ncbi:hypothetical protein FRC07_008545, partial [Ceratobasidium sp. 392]
VEDAQASASRVSSLENKRGSKNTAWSGLKALLGVLNKSADVFPPLKLAVVGLSESVEIFEASLTT